MPAGRPKSIDNSKVFDVAKPGKSRPVSTSRPVIMKQGTAVADQDINTGDNKDLSSPSSVGRRTISPIDVSYGSSENKDSPVSSITVLRDEPVEGQDPSTAPIVATRTRATKSQISTEAQAETAKATNDTPSYEPVESNQTMSDIAPVATVKRELQLKPLAQTSPMATDTNNTDAGTAITNKPDVGSQTQTQTNAGNSQPVNLAASGSMPSKTSTESTETKIADTQEYGSESASIDALANASEKTKQDKKADEEQAQREAALQELIDSKKYFVPLAHDSTQKSGNAAAAILLLLIVAAVGIYLAIDAKLLKLNVNVPYHFFKQ